MKARTLLKLLAHSLLLSLSVCGVALAQDPDSEWKPLKGFDYTAQTIDGQRINIDSLVRAGKKVVLDFSGTFCRPCWAIHNVPEKSKTTFESILRLRPISMPHKLSAFSPFF